MFVFLRIKKINRILWFFIFFCFGNSSSFALRKTDALQQLLFLKKSFRNASGFNLSEKFKIQAQIESQEKHFGGDEFFFRRFKARSQKIFFGLMCLPIIFWQVVVLFLWLLMLFFIIFQIFKIRFFSKIFLALIFLFSCFALRISLLENRADILVLVDDAKLYSGPDMCFPVLAPVPQGSSGKKQDEQDSFLKVEFKNNLGWILKSNVEEIV